MFKDKKVLVTGATGMIGRELVKLLLKSEAIITTTSLDDILLDNRITHIQADLTDKDACNRLVYGQNYVFHLAGIKGSPSAAMTKPATFFKMVQFNTNMTEAAFNNGCDWYLFTSSVGVYGPAEVFKEEDIYVRPPSRNDWYAGHFKRVGELQAEAYAVQYGWDRYSIIRPANVYGNHDLFDKENGMIIPSLIARMIDNPYNDLELSGDGSNIRDFIHARDVARAMIYMVENEVLSPCNIGSGNGYSIFDVVHHLRDITNFKGNIIWNTELPSGDKKRIMDMKRLESLGYQRQIDIRAGLKETVDWYINNKQEIHNRSNYFK